MALSEKIWASSIGAFVAYGKTAAAAALKPLLVADNGDGTGTLQVGAAAGSNLIGKVGIDQATANANEVVVKNLATTCTMDSITLTAANTEYSKALPANCKKLTFRCVDSTKIAPGSDIRYSFETDKVHDSTLPFMLLDGGSVYSESNLNLTSKTLYVAGVTAGDIVLLEMWT